jgi:hypothetical protein
MNHQRSDLKDKDFSESKAKTRKLSRLRLILAVRTQAWNIFQGLYRVIRLAEKWDDLTPFQRIQLEEHGTEKLLEFLEFCNCHVFHGVHYRLREKEPEEEGTE